MTAHCDVVPFSLTFQIPAPVIPDETRALMDTAVLDQQSQMTLFNGRPLSELTLLERMTTSQPTETDGKDPISVDSDPFYDK